MGPFVSHFDRFPPSVGGQAIRILLVAGYASVRESIAAVLNSQSDMQAWECAGTEEALQFLSGTPVDVVVLKHNAGDGGSNGFLPELQRLGLTARILVFTAWMSRMEKRNLIEAGVGGVFRKQRRLGELTAAIRHIARGGTWFEEAPERPTGAQEQSLSEREELAANLVAEGLSNKEIALQMNASEGYVKGLLQRVFLKLGVHSRGQLVAMLMSQRMARD